MISENTKPGTKVFNSEYGFGNIIGKLHGNPHAFVVEFAYDVIPMHRKELTEVN